MQLPGVTEEPGSQRNCTGSTPRPRLGYNGYRPLVSEVSDAGKDHCHLTIAGRLNDFIVAHRTSWLNDRSCPCLCGGDQPIRKWKKRVTCDRTALQREARFSRFPDRNPRGVDPRHLTR